MRRMHGELLVQGRLEAWIIVTRLIAKYAVAIATGRAQVASELLNVIRRHPFSGVVSFLGMLSVAPQPRLVSDEVAQVVYEHPELLE